MLEDLYVIIPNYVIMDSFAVNNYLAYVTAYVEIFHNQGKVGITSIEAITKKLYGNDYEKRSKKHEAIKDAMILLSEGTDEIDSYSYWFFVYDEDVKDIGYNSIITYEICHGKVIGYTPLTYTEFDAILYFCNEWNNSKGNSKVDTVIILNMYLLLKMNIRLKESINKRTGDKDNYFIGTKKLREKTNLNKETIRKYINFLVEIGFIKIPKKGGLSSGESNEYVLCNSAIKKFESVCEEENDSSDSNEEKAIIDSNDEDELDFEF